MKGKTFLYCVKKLLKEEMTSLGVNLYVTCYCVYYLNPFYYDLF